MNLKFAVLEDHGRPAGTMALEAAAFPRELGIAVEEASAAPQGFVIVERDAGVRQALGQVLPLLVRRVRQQLDADRGRALEELVEGMLADRILPDAPGNAAERAMVAAAAERREAFLRDWPCVSGEALHRAAGLGAKNMSATASRWKAAGMVFAIRVGGRDLYPAFQFDGGRPLPGVARVLAALGPKVDGWQIATWMTAANGWLPGNARPADLLAGDADAVEKAARMAVAEPAS